MLYNFDILCNDYAVSDVVYVGIDSYMVRQKNLIKFLNYPWIVKKCADAILDRGLELEGIFRVPGNHLEVEEICESFENGELRSKGVIFLEKMGKGFLWSGCKL